MCIIACCLLLLKNRMDAVFKLGVFALQKLLNWKHGSFKLGVWGVFLLVKAVVSNIRVIFSHFLS